LKVYLLWGRNEYFTDLHVRLTFTPRVQMHITGGEGQGKIDGFTRAVSQALKNLDPDYSIMVFKPDTGTEMF
jgi:uncharacterized radical SAM superfamily protein